MRLTELVLKGFRNLRDTALSFDPGAGLFVFVGDNGQGKTNLLEAIFIADLSKSFRVHGNEDLIGFDRDFCRIEATLKGGDAELLEVIVERAPARKTLKVNGVVKKVTEFIGHLPVVFFSPDEMAMIHQAPGLRRRYLDVLLCQLDRDYLEALIEYTQAIRHRNTLLRQLREKRGKPDELDFWDEKTAGTGAVLIQKRRAITDRLNPIALRHYQDIAGKKDALVIGYLASADAEQLSEKLSANRDRDIAAGATSVGPHRDDLAFFCNGHDLKLFGSRGEWRSLVLALKFGEMELLRERLGSDPLLLLDDVFSELDERRQKYLLSSLNGAQTFITTTHLEFLTGVPSKKQVYRVTEGGVGEI